MKHRRRGREKREQQRKKFLDKVIEEKRELKIQSEKKNRE